jgi:hypothetical protein
MTFRGSHIARRSPFDKVAALHRSFRVMFDIGE